jgi:hypothetical protein
VAKNTGKVDKEMNGGPRPTRVTGSDVRDKAFSGIKGWDSCDHLISHFDLLLSLLYFITIKFMAISIKLIAVCLMIEAEDVIYFHYLKK